MQTAVFHAHPAAHHPALITILQVLIFNHPVAAPHKTDGMAIEHQCATS